MRNPSFLVIGAVLAALLPSAHGKEKYEEVTELQFMANKTRLIGQNIALLTYMGDVNDVSGRVIPSAEKETGNYAVSAMTARKLVKFTIPDTKENEKTIELFYTLAPGTQGQKGSQITIYGKVVRISDEEVFILVQRDSGLAIEEGWPDDKSPCPTCGRPGYSGPKKGQPPPKKKSR